MFTEILFYLALAYAEGRALSLCPYCRGAWPGSSRPLRGTPEPEAGEAADQVRGPDLQGQGWGVLHRYPGTGPFTCLQTLESPVGAFQVKCATHVFKNLSLESELSNCLQRIQGELFLFMDLCGNIVGALGT